MKTQDQRTKDYNRSRERGRDDDPVRLPREPDECFAQLGNAAAHKAADCIEDQHCEQQVQQPHRSVTSPMPHKRRSSYYVEGQQDAVVAMEQPHHAIADTLNCLSRYQEQGRQEDQDSHRSALLTRRYLEGLVALTPEKQRDGEHEKSEERCHHASADVVAHLGIRANARTDAQQEWNADEQERKDRSQYSGGEYHEKEHRSASHVQPNQRAYDCGCDHERGWNDDPVRLPREPEETLIQ